MNTASRLAGKQHAHADKLYMENTLLRVAGALFCHDRRNAPTRTQAIELNKGIAERQIVIRPDPEFGQPGPLAHKIFVALIKKHSGQGRRTQADVSFSKRELMRLIGRTGWGGKDSEELSRALNEIHHAFVRTGFKENDKRYVEHSFNIFPEIYVERRETATDPIEACTVTLARPIIASLHDGHFTCLNHALMQELGTIGQALYMRLFFHFANLYDGHHEKRLVFAKRYDDICHEWLGGIQVLKYRSKIEGEQLGRHLRQLVALGFLASYAIEPARGREGLVITFRPGAVFFADYARFYHRRESAAVGFDVVSDQAQLGDPLKVAYLFAEKRTGKPLKGIPYVPSKDVETARHFLAHLAFNDIPGFLDFALRRAKSTRFDVQTLGGLKQYLNEYLDNRRRKVATDQFRNNEEQATRYRIEYDHFRKQAADRIFKNLPAKERIEIEATAKKTALSTGRPGALAETMLRIERVRIVAERYPIPSFDEWKASTGGQQ